ALAVPCRVGNIPEHLQESATILVPIAPIYDEDAVLVPALLERRRDVKVRGARCVPSQGLRRIVLDTPRRTLLLRSILGHSQAIHIQPEHILPPARPAE